MTASWRFSALADRHRALGSNLEDWSGMGTAWTYDKDWDEEYIAIRTKAGIMDVSGLKKVHITGPHASHVIDYATTRNVEKIYPGKSIYRMGPNSWMVVHGSGTGHEELTKAAMGRDVSVRFDDNLHDLSLQGPLAVDYLAEYVPGIRDLPYFHHTQTQLFGAPVMISRTGYTGERGYEIFCRAQDAGMIWDRIVAEGKDMGIIPTRFTTLDMLRVESYLDFTVSPGKTGFRGAEEHYRLKGKERFKIFGILFDGKEVPAEGAEVFKDGAKVGVVTCAMYSPLKDQTMAIARLAVDCAEQGVRLEVTGEKGMLGGMAHTMPFDDPKKLKRTAKG